MDEGINNMDLTRAQIDALNYEDKMRLIRPIIDDIIDVYDEPIYSQCKAIMNEDEKINQIAKHRISDTLINSPLNKFIQDTYFRGTTTNYLLLRSIIKYIKGKTSNDKDKGESIFSILIIVAIYNASNNPDAFYNEQFKNGIKAK